MKAVDLRLEAAQPRHRPNEQRGYERPDVHAAEENHRSVEALLPPLGALRGWQAALDVPRPKPSRQAAECASERTPGRWRPDSDTAAPPRWPRRVLPVGTRAPRGSVDAPTVTPASTHWAPSRSPPPAPPEIPAHHPRRRTRPTPPQAAALVRPPGA
eukprot:scaffold52_cov246-Pinguiococcus_pyrenoidosus.AAC.10